MTVQKLNNLIYASDISHMQIVLNVSKKSHTYISMEFCERVVHIKPMHVNNCSIYCQLGAKQISLRKTLQWQSNYSMIIFLFVSINQCGYTEINT